MASTGRRPEFSTSGRGCTFWRSLRTTSRKSLRLGRWSEQVDETLHEDLGVLLTSTWDIYHASPLFGFEGTEIRLKQYSQKLTQLCALMNVNEDVEYRVEFKSIHNVGFSGCDSVIKVRVLCHKEGDNGEKVIYLGFILSWGSIRKSFKRFLHLPVLLCKAKTIAVKMHIHGALQKMFDCVVSQYVLGEMQLLWLNSLFLNTSKEAAGERKNVARLTLVPIQNPRKNKVELYLNLYDLRKIWARIHHQGNDTIEFDETRMLYNGIIKTVSEDLLIKLSRFRIYEIKYPDVTLRVPGKFACRHLETLNELLSFLYNEKPCINAWTGDYLEDTL